MSDPKLVITEESWERMTYKQQSKITYDTVISMRGDVIDLRNTVETLANKPSSPCVAMESRIEKLEKWSKFKAIGTIIAGFFSGVGGSHIPK